MRTTSWIALAALFVAPTGVCAQQSSQKSATAQASQSNSASRDSASSSQQEDPLVLAARKAREQRKNKPQAAKVFDNDNLPTSGGISTVGATSSTPSTNDKNEKDQKTQSASSSPAGSDADAWRSKFANLRQKLQQDQSELSVMQRELGQDALQYYNGDPQKAAQDQASGHPMGEEYDKKQAAIDAKQKQVDADQQAISNAQDALRQSGGDPGWAR